MTLGLFLNTDIKGIGIDIFGKKDLRGMCLTSKEKIFHMHDIKNIRLNGKLYSAIIPNDEYLSCYVNQGEKLTLEIYFPRLPKEIKSVNLIFNNNAYNIEAPFNYLNIQIKYNGDDKTEKNLLNKMELNKPFTLNNIYFETGKSELLESSFAELNTLFNILILKGFL